MWDKEQIRKLGVMDSLCAFFISVDDDVYLFSAGNFLKLERTDATEISEETKALVNKMKGEYKPVKALAFCAPDNVPYSGTVKVPKEVDKNIRIVIDEDYVAGTGMLYSSAEYHAYNTSDESLREIIGMDLGVLQYELDDIDVKNGECLVVYDCNSQVRKLPQFFLLYDDEVYTRLGYYYVKLKKIN